MGLRNSSIHLAIVVIFAVTPQPGSGAERPADAWEARPTGKVHGCTEIDRSLILPVPVSHRAAAVARLEDASMIELDRAATAVLLDLHNSKWDASGAMRIKAAIRDLSAQRRHALDDHVGSWSGADQKRLEQLRVLAADRSSTALRPFLVRAIAKNEGTGGFYATVCTDSLMVVHASLGHSIPASVRLPIVVFLKRKPANVYVDWQMDQ